jgi:hypothetical protein
MNGQFGFPGGVLVLSLSFAHSPSGASTKASAATNPKCFFITFMIHFPLLRRSAFEKVSKILRSSKLGIRYYGA